MRSNKAHSTISQLAQRRLFFDIFCAGLLTCFVSLIVTTKAYPATITISANTSGTTPSVVGYNLAHFVSGSNIIDYWRYSNIKAARAFISPSHIEPNDDLGSVGDGVSSADTFANRKTALRSNVKSDTNLTGTTYINWSLFKQRYATPDTSSNNLFSVEYAFSSLRQQGVEILANISCSPSRFSLSGETDWPNLWEIWQHYYAQGFYLAKKFDVVRYGIMNEPNNWSPAIAPEDWLLRLRIASDALQSAIADVNAVTGKQLVPQIFAPNTANGASKYDDVANGDNWGQVAVQNRHLPLNGQSSQSWWNFHIYNYQKYSRQQYNTSTATGYIDDYNLLKSKIASEIGTETLPLALTEFNSRTGANYDLTSATSDTPEDYAALGASLVALSPARQLYLFKFGMTDSDGGTYPVAKNGTHYVDNASSLRSYGGASSTAEVYRLYNKAARGARPILPLSGAPTDVWTLATREQGTGEIFIFVANKTTSAQTLSFSVSALGIANNSLVTTEEVSLTSKGGVKTVTSVQSGTVPSASLPAQSVWLITITPTSSTPTPSVASENVTLQDSSSGSYSKWTASTTLTVRSDGSVNGRRITLLKIPTTASPSTAKKVLLSLRASTLSTSKAVQAHVYGLENDAWTEAGATFGNIAQLKTAVPAGNQIGNNVVEDNRSKTKLVGQLWVNASTLSERHLDVTDFVRSQTDGFASFMIVQDHRWSAANQLKSGTGDTQADGIKIAARSSSQKPTLKFYP